MNVNNFKINIILAFIPRFIFYFFHYRNWSKISTFLLVSTVHLFSFSHFHVNDTFITDLLYILCLYVFCNLIGGIQILYL